MNNKTYIIIVVLMVIFFIYGISMYYNSGLGVTDLSVEKVESDNNQYSISYLLRSVRPFDKVDCEYVLLTSENTQIATGTDELTDITDGTYNVNSTINVSDNNNELIIGKIQIVLYEISAEENNDRKLIFNKTMDV